MENLFIYTRVSSEQQLHGYSLQVQQDEGVKLALVNNLLPVVLNEGAESSAYEDFKNRPVITQLLQRINTGEVKHLFVIATDRLSRNENTMGVIKYALWKHKVKLYTKNGIYDFESPTDKLMFGLLGLFSEYENTVRAMRFGSAYEKAIESKFIYRGQTPFGYTQKKGKEAEINETEAKVVRKIFELYNIDMGTYKISKYLEQENIQTRKGVIWSDSTIVKILSNPVYCGERIHNGKVVKSVPIVDKKTWDKAQRIMKRKERKKGINKKHFYLLDGLVKCICEKSMVGLNRPKQKSYVCVTKGQGYNFCGTKNINRIKLDRLVWCDLIYVLQDAKILHKKIKQQIDALPKLEPKIRKDISMLKSKLKDTQKKKNTITDLFIDGKVDKKYLDLKLDEQNELLEQLEQEIDKKEEQLKNIFSTQGQYSIQLKRLQEFERITGITDEKEQRDIIREFIEKVEVGWLNDEKIHAVKVYFTDPINTNTLLLDGTDLETGENIQLKVLERLDVTDTINHNDT